MKRDARGRRMEISLCAMRARKTDFKLELCSKDLAPFFWRDSVERRTDDAKNDDGLTTARLCL